MSMILTLWPGCSHALPQGISGLYVVACPLLPDKQGTCLCLGDWSHRLVHLYTSPGHSCTDYVLGSCILFM